MVSMNTPNVKAHLSIERATGGSLRQAGGVRDQREYPRNQKSESSDSIASPDVVAHPLGLIPRNNLPEPLSHKG
jgi:hypothetical protein